MGQIWGGEGTAVVVGSGPNGLAAAITLADAGLRVRVLEAADSPGGGLRSFRNERFGTLHDHCSAVHPLARISPFFRRFGLEREVRFVTPPRAWAQAMEADSGGASALPSAAGPVSRSAASFAGVAAHAMLPPASPLALGTGALLGGAGLLSGWPIPVGGSQAIADALVRRAESLGVLIECGRRVDPADLPAELEAADLVFWDTDPAAAHRAVSPGGPSSSRRYGPGAAKADFVTSASIPWRDPRLRRAGTVHLGGAWGEVARAEREVNAGRLPAHPFSLVSQPSLFDPTRAPEGLHTVWAYAHVPHGSRADPAEIITREIERFAPGFAATVLDVTTTTAAGFPAFNPNCVGGDIASGATRGWQLLTSGTLARGPVSGRGPVPGKRFQRGLLAAPWALPREGWFLCSGATPPGPGVHGMSGHIAARLALRELRRRRG